MPKLKKHETKIDTLDEIAKAANDSQAQSHDDLVHMSIRIHKDLLKRIKFYAESEHRMFSETVRDLLLTGMRERGI